MKIIEPSVELVNAPSYPNILSLIEQAGRTCYKSESKITEDSAEKFVRNILKRGHEAVIEHGVVTVRFICDREWRHFIKLRSATAAHPDMRRVARMLYDLLSVRYPVFFEDIKV